MKVIQTVKEMQSIASKLRQKNKKIGFVPTMGYLHNGHLSLVAKAKEYCEVIVMSIYVNPTQFGPHEDLDKYPRDFKRDEALARDAGVDYIFYPSDDEMYSNHYLTYVSVDNITNVLCGASRPDHFKGVTTICAKLFNIVQPHVAVFGQKDAQQAIVIRRMVADLNFNLKIVVAPIIRESDGLAMSSRNRYLSSNEREDATRLNQSLQLAQKMIDSGELQALKVKTAIQEYISTSPNAKIDYIALVDPETLQSVEIINQQILIALAVFIGQTRLIDNILISIE